MVERTVLRNSVPAQVRTTSACADLRATVPTLAGDGSRFVSSATVWRCEERHFLSSPRRPNPRSGPYYTSGIFVVLAAFGELLPLGAKAGPSCAPFVLQLSLTLIHQLVGAYSGFEDRLWFRPVQPSVSGSELTDLQLYGSSVIGSVHWSPCVLLKPYNLAISLKLLQGTALSINRLATRVSVCL